MIRVALALAVTQVTAGWLHAATLSGALTLAAVALAVAAIALVTHAPWLHVAVTTGPLQRRAIALRRQSWGAAYQRQRNPDAAGRARPRAPSAAPAAA